MKNNVTIKDIAEKAGVSIGSVHIALSGKPGVGKATRDRICAIAAEMNYRPNLLARNLKRDALEVVVALPRKNEYSHFYFDFMRMAAADYSNHARDYKLNLRFVDMEDISSIADDDIGGVITMGYPRKDLVETVRKLSGRGIPVILLDSDLPDTGRLCSVQPDLDILGDLTAQLLKMNLRRADGDILICAGYHDFPHHKLIADRICAYFKKNHIHNQLHWINFEVPDDESVELIKTCIMTHPIIGACSVNSRSTTVLARAVEELKRTADIPIIGSELYPETYDYVKKGVITAIVRKRPYAQCRQGLYIMQDYLARGIAPDIDVIHPAVDVVFSTTLGQYDKEKGSLTK
ncbi:MAG: substrate-binding domain-containing protein [Eubacteriales bacterium]|nr:substrate-binding domain-containing protein [Eubacteriales bacterium]